MGYIVFTDTSSNLPSDMLESLGVEVVPFSYFVDGQETKCLDTRSFNGDEYYGAIKKGVQVTTAQVPPQRYIDYFTPALEQGQDVLFISMSSGISGSCDSARIAAEELKERFPLRTVRIIDTLAASLGEGIVVLRAAELHNAGVTLSRATEELNALSRRVCQVFTVDDLMHLRRGGRLSNLSAVVGTVLHIKPILIGNEEGKIFAVAKLRGRKRSIEALAERYDALAVNPEEQIIGIAHAGCREDADKLAELLNKNHPPKEILIVDYEPMTGAHVGPGALALFFVGNDDVRSVR